MDLKDVASSNQKAQESSTRRAKSAGSENDELQLYRRFRLDE